MRAASLIIGRALARAVLYVSGAKREGFTIDDLAECYDLITFNLGYLKLYTNTLGRENLKY